jgi:hypothetical protein
MLKGAQRLAILIFIFSMVCLFSAWCNLLKKNASTPSPIITPQSKPLNTTSMPKILFHFRNYES